MAKDRIVLDLAVIEFCGMARIGELNSKTCFPQTNKGYPNLSNVCFEETRVGCKALISIQEAKKVTLRKIQLIMLNSQ